MNTQDHQAKATSAVNDKSMATGAQPRPTAVNHRHLAEDGQERVSDPRSLASPEHPITTFYTVRKLKDKLALITKSDVDTILADYAESGTRFGLCCERARVKPQLAWMCIQSDKTLLDLYMRIRQTRDTIRAEDYADESIDIADTEDKASKGLNRIKSRQWLASKLDKERYGEKVQIESKNLDVKVVYPVRGDESLHREESTT